MTTPSNLDNQRQQDHGLITPGGEKRNVVNRRNLLIGSLGLGAASVFGASCKLEESEEKKLPKDAGTSTEKELPEKKVILPGSQVMAEYEKIGIPKGGEEKIPLMEIWRRRHMFVLQQIVNRNVPDHFGFEKLEIEGKAHEKNKKKSRSVLEVEVAKHNLRLGTNEDYIDAPPLDAPHAAAAAALFANAFNIEGGCTLETRWIHQQAYRQAKRIGQVVKFFTDEEVAEHPDTKNTLGLRVPYNKLSKDQKKALKKAPAMIRARNVLIQKWRQDKGISDDQLTGGEFKGIIQPMPDQEGEIKREKVYIYGGYSHDADPKEPIQPKGSRHDWWYFDYSHGLRIVKNMVTLDGVRMTLHEFHRSLKNSIEFGQHATPIRDWTYAYPPHLTKFMMENTTRTYPDWVNEMGVGKGKK